MRHVSKLFVCCIVLCVVAAAPSVWAVDTSDSGMSEWVAKGETEGACSADVICSNGSLLSCTGSYTCTAVDGTCPLHRGKVTCDGTTYYCPYCPAGNCPMAYEDCITSAMCRGTTEPPCSQCYCYFPAPYTKDTQEYIPPGGGEEGRCVCP